MQASHNAHNSHSSDESHNPNEEDTHLVTELRIYEEMVRLKRAGEPFVLATVRGALASEARFIGLLGSRRKREVLLRTLSDEGYSEEQRARVVTPVGVEIGAETPEEIAVSIVGQLVRERRHHGG